MRIPFPERVNVTYALAFAGVLSGVEVLQGTNPMFAGCVFCFIVLGAVSFNIAGGIAFPSGAFVFFNSFFTVILPCTVKALIGDPADAYLRAPVRTMEIYLCGSVGMFVAVVFSRKFRARRALISDMLPRESLRSAYIGSGLLSILIVLYLTFLSGAGGNGSFTSFLLQINRFPLLTFVLGVLYTVQRTEGQRSVSWPLIAMMAYFSLGAFLTFSKEQLLSPPFAWAVTCALVRYKIDWLNVAVFFLGVFLLVTYMIPYAAYGRGLEAGTRSQSQLAYYLLTHMDEVQQGYEDSAVNQTIVHFYDRNRGLLTRLEVFSVDDALVEVTDRNGAFGYEPVIESFESLVPHVLWPDKPFPYFGNNYAHEIGVIADQDIYTGVSFSPAADAYHEGKMVGLLVVLPLMLMLVFTVLDSVIGDVRLNPVGLLTTIMMARSATEGALFGQTYIIGQFLFANVMAALFCAYVLPVLGSVLSRSPLQTTEPVMPVHRGSMPQTVSTL